MLGHSVLQTPALFFCFFCLFSLKLMSFPYNNMIRKIHNAFDIIVFYLGDRVRTCFLSLLDSIKTCSRKSR